MTVELNGHRVVCIALYNKSCIRLIDARHTYQIITFGDEEKEDIAYSSIKSAKLR